MRAPARSERDGDRLAQAGIGAGDECALARQIEEGRHALCPHRSSDMATMSMSVIVLVVAAHRPDEGIVAGADAGMDRPAGRQDRLLVRHDQVRVSFGSPMRCTTRASSSEIEIEVGLRAAVVRVARHGVPHAARLKLRHAHDELARLADLRNDVSG